MLLIYRFEKQLKSQACLKYVQNMFKRGDLQSRFKFFLTGRRSFATIKIPITLLVTDLTRSPKNDFF